MPNPASKTPAEPPKPPQLQPDDLQILQKLASDFLLLTDEQIFQLFPDRPPRAIKRRLDRLVDLGYLSRRFPGTLFLSTIRPAYAVGAQAANLPMLDISNSQGLARLQKSRDFSDMALAHLLFANFVQIKFQTAIHDHPDYQFESWTSQYDPVWTRLNQSGFNLRPDGLAKIWKGNKRFFYFIEADRDTYRGKHLEKRLALYARHASKYPHSAAFEFKHPRFRVLFIAESVHRAKRMLKAFSPHHPDLFWVTTWQEFSKQSLLHPQWRSHDSSVLHALQEPCELPPEPPEPPSPPSI
jgi:hypothetical protein